MLRISKLTDYGTVVLGQNSRAADLDAVRSAAEVAAETGLGLANGQQIALEDHSQRRRPGHVDPWRQRRLHACRVIQSDAISAAARY